MSAANSFGFNRPDCLITISNFSPNSSIFLFGSTPQNPTVSFIDCELICGDLTSWFPDSFPRLDTWLLPVVILLINLQFPTANGSRRKWLRARSAACVHVLADPTDFIFSLILQVEAWNRCLAQAEKLRPRRPDQNDKEHNIEIKNVAIILAAFDRIVDPVGDVTSSNLLFERLSRTLFFSDEKRPIATEFEKKIADGFAAAHSNSLVPALLALIFYVWQVVGAFVSVIGGSSSPSGGKIASALLLSWIIPVVLFSNNVGEFSSSNAFTLQMGEYLRDRDPIFEEERLDELVRTGFSSTYSRRNNIRSNDHIRGRSLRLLLFISSVPVYQAVAFSVTVTSIPPTYLSIRHFLFVPLGLYYIFAPRLTQWVRNHGGMGLLLAKDSAIALVVMTLLIVASCGGFFNNCQGWIPIYPRNLGVALNPVTFGNNTNFVLPLLVTLCLGLQMGFWGMMWSICRRGLGVMKYSRTWH